jgi:hypothetical protein
MHAPDMGGAIELSDDTSLYIELLAKLANTVGRTFPSGNDDCCIAIATQMAYRFDSKECSAETLGRALERALCSC